MQLIDTTTGKTVEARITTGAGTAADPYRVRTWGQGHELARSLGSPVLCRVGSDATLTTFHPPVTIGLEPRCMLVRDLKINSTTVASIVWDTGGCHIEYYRDSDGGSGFGDGGQCAKWYGPHANCLKRVAQKTEPEASDWYDLPQQEAMR